MKILLFNFYYCVVILYFKNMNNTNTEINSVLVKVYADFCVVKSKYY